MSVSGPAELNSAGRVQLSPRVVLYPAGSPAPVVASDGIALPQISTAAFGDGSHPTTRLCAGAMDLILRRDRPASVLDVGTGTGVLARIARARGVGWIAATDIDPVALEAARANVALDDHAKAIEIADRPPDAWGPRFELVVANILETPLRELAPALAAALAPGGQLLISGFTPLQSPGLRVAFAAVGLAVAVESEAEGWSLLALRLRQENPENRV